MIAFAEAAVVIHEGIDWQRRGERLGVEIQSHFFERGETMGQHEGGHFLAGGSIVGRIEPAAQRDAVGVLELDVLSAHIGGEMNQESTVFECQATASDAHSWPGRSTWIRIRQNASGPGSSIYILDGATRPVPESVTDARMYTERRFNLTLWYQ